MKTIRALRQLVCSFILLLFAQPIYAQGACEQWLGKLASAQGKVEIRRAGTSIWRPVTRGERYCDMDAIRTGRNSRAVLMLNTDPSNRTLTNLNQNTFLTFKSLGNEPTTFDLLIDLFKGGALFRSRQPNRLDIDTPFVNAVHKGTEFLVQVDPDQTLVTVYDGQVATSNAEGNLTIDKGETALAKRGKGPVKYAVVRPRDAVQWALNYPPVIDYQAASSTPYHPAIGDALSAYRRGDLLKALAILDQVPEAQRETDYYTTKAGLFLSVGRVDEATPAIEKALTLDSKNATAFALKSVIAVAQNRNDEAMQLAEQAAELEPESPTPQVALSYAHQAKFELEQALESAEKAVELGPVNALALSRLSELQLSMGDLDEALKAAEKATALDPDLARTQTVLGFAYLTKIDIDEARQTFEKAIELDQAAPLPRLGLGLAKIRKGELKDGTDEIEIAASLDPDNSLIRSYLGKAFYEKKENLLAGTELEIAKELDPNDPTPWFYDAIRKQTTNRPVEALHDMQKAIELNDNRAVYRSRLLLDDDLAARSASLGRIYNDLGFQQRGLLEGWKSVNADPSNFSAHRLLADNYASLPRHEIARVSELLQSQLLQPVNIAPLQSELSETNLAILEGAGPSGPSFNELNPLFTRDGFALQANGVVGKSATWGDNLIFSGIQGPISFSVSQFHQETDGFRDNDDIEHDIYSAFGQFSITQNFGIQTEYRRRRTKSGDTAVQFIGSDPDLDQTLKQETIRFGTHYEINPSQDIIASFIYGNANQFIQDPSLPVVDIELRPEVKGYQFGLQHLYRTTHLTTIAGLEYIDQKETIDNTVEVLIGPNAGLRNTSSKDNPSHFNAHFYAPIKVASNLSITLGGSFDAFDGSGVDKNQFNPKLGLLWAPTSFTTIRLAAFQALKRSFTSNQTIEPTQVAGFNQFFDDPAGSKSKRYGLGLDQQFSPDILGGIAVSWRDVSQVVRRIVDEQFDAEERDIDEIFHRGYLYWTPNNNFAFHGEYQFENFDREGSGAANDPDDLRTHNIELGANFYMENGLITKLKATYVDQTVKFRRVGPGQLESREGNNDFWNFDVSVGYRLPKRYGLVSFDVRNLFDREFQFQNSFNPEEPRVSRFQPDRAYFATVRFWFY